MLEPRAETLSQQPHPTPLGVWSPRRSTILVEAPTSPHPPGMNFPLKPGAGADPVGRGCRGPGGLKLHSQSAWKRSWKGERELSPFSFCAFSHYALLATSPVQLRANEASALYLLGNKYVPKYFMLYFMCNYRPEVYRLMTSSKIKLINQLAAIY